jgi:hypothetical protein
MAQALRPRYFRSNFIDFICLQDYSLTQTDTTRLSFDADYPSIENPCYFTRIKKTELAWVQYRHVYNAVSVYLVDENDNQTNLTSNISPGQITPSGARQYELSFDTSTLAGYYYLRFDYDQDFDKPELNYQSEWFYVATAAELKYYQLVECQNINFSPYNDGIVWGAESQRVYIFSTTIDLQPGTDQSVFVTEKRTLKTSQEYPIKSKLWKIDLIPDYLIEKLSIFMAHEYFKIDGVRYNREGSFDTPERQGNTRLYPAEKELREIEDIQGNNYEDYSKDQVIEGNIPTTDPFAIYAGVGAALFAGTGAAIGYE